MHALVHLYINQQTRYEVPNFTNSKNMTGAKLKKNKLAPCGTDGRLFTA